MLQEFAPGEGFGIEVLLDAGAPRLIFAHRRLKEYPASGGVSVIAESVTPPPALVERALRLLRHIGWTGIAMVEFRWQQAMERATLMEINGRFWGSMALSQACGVDFAYAAWRRPITCRRSRSLRTLSGARTLDQRGVPAPPGRLPSPSRRNATARLRYGVVDRSRSLPARRSRFAVELAGPSAGTRRIAPPFVRVARDEIKALVRVCVPIRALDWWRASRSQNQGQRESMSGGSSATHCSCADTGCRGRFDRYYSSAAGINA